MDQVSAYNILAAEVEAFLSLDFEELQELVGYSEAKRVTGENAIEYLAEVTMQNPS